MTPDLYLWTGLVLSIIQVGWCIWKSDVLVPRTYEFLAANQMLTIWLYFLTKGA